MSDQQQQGRRQLARSLDAVKLDGLQPGNDDTLIRFGRLDQQRALLRQMLDGTGSSIVVLADTLDPAVWSDSSVITALRHCLQRNRSASLRIAVNSSSEIVRSSSPMVELIRGFIPAAECRIRRPMPSGFEANCVVIDSVCYLYLPDRERHGGTACFNGVATAARLLDVFAREWELAQPDPEMRLLEI